MTTINKVVCAAGAALILGGCQSIPSSAQASAEVAVVPQQESYFPSDVALKELLQALVERGSTPT